MNLNLWIGNVPPEASDEELAALVKKYCNRECKVVLRVDGDGSTPGRLLEVSDLAFGEIDEIVQRIDGLYWKQRLLLAYQPQHTGPERRRSSTVTKQSPDGHASLPRPKQS